MRIRPLSRPLITLYAYFLAHNKQETMLPFEWKQNPAGAVVQWTPDFYKWTFYHDGKEIGVLDFSGPAMTFAGDIEESAKLFFGEVAKLFAERLRQEREQAGCHTH